jgi:hypothetical protein
VPVFLDEYFGRAFLHVAGSGDRFSWLVSHDALSQGVADAAQNMERELEAPVHAKLAGSAVVLHRLERDEIILQVRGQSECAIHTDADGAASETPEWQGPLRSGDVLYVPGGWWLATTRMDPSAVQVSFEIENPTGADLFDWIAGHLKRHPTFQKSIPRFADPATRADYVRDLRRVLGHILREPRLLERHRRDRNLKSEPRSTAGAILWTDGAPGTQQIAILTPRKLRIKRADHETLLLVAIGKRLAFPQDAAPLLHYLCDHAPVSTNQFFANFEKEFDREELCGFLAVLSKEGIIGLREVQSNG